MTRVRRDVGRRPTYPGDAGSRIQVDGRHGVAANRHDEGIATCCATHARRRLPAISIRAATPAVGRARSARRRLLLAFVLAVGCLVPLTPGAVQPVLARSPQAQFSFPGLGRIGDTRISGPVYGFGCGAGGGQRLQASIYRWGCGNPGNRYLLGHARASFKPLHDFVQARGGSPALKQLVGKTATYDPTHGPKVRYRVVWARIVGIAYFNRTFDEWASNATKRDSLTMQTCYGDHSQYRIIVRLERIRGVSGS